MPRWRCPNCDRAFGRAHQSHTCVPANSLAETFTGFPAAHREVCRLLIERMRTFGPLEVDPVRVGVFFSAMRKFAELRTRQRWLLLYLMLPDRIEDRRVRRHEPLAGGRVMHVIRLDRPEDVDDQLADWLALAYDAATD